MSFSRSTYDLAIGEPMVLYNTTITKSELGLCDRLRVGLGTGGGTISLGTAKRTGSNRFPSNVLVCLKSGQPVGMLAADFIVSGKFGIMENNAERIAIAEEIGTQYDIVTYETSIEKFG